MTSRTAACLFAIAFGAAPALAQTSQPVPAQSTGTKNQQQKPAKKVWTNDDLSELTGNFGVTTATATLPTSVSESGTGAASGSGATAPGQSKDLPPEKDPKVYRAKLAALRAQLDDLDAKIKQTQDAIDHPIDGKNSIKLGQQGPNFPKQDQAPDYQQKRPDDSIYGNQVVRPQDQLTVYKQKRDAVQQQIDDLEAQARQNGIAPGDIR